MEAQWVESGVQGHSVSQRQSGDQTQEPDFLSGAMLASSRFYSGKLNIPMFC